MTKYVRLLAAVVCCATIAIILSLSNAAACSKCDALGNCVPAGAGQAGWVLCNPNPADGTCDVSGHCHGAALQQPEATVVTMAMLFHSTSSATDRLLSGGTKQRLLRFHAQEPELATLLRTLGEASGTDATDWRLSYWHTSVSSAPTPMRVVSRQGSGYEVSATPLIGAARLAVWSAENGKQTNVAARVSPGDVLLVRTTVDGESYVLALRAVSVAESDPQLVPKLVALQRNFKEQAHTASAADLLALNWTRDAEGAE